MSRESRMLAAAYFLSVASPDATEANGVINLAYAGAVSLALGVLTLGIGLIARRARESVPVSVERRPDPRVPALDQP